MSKTVLPVILVEQIRTDANLPDDVVATIGKPLAAALGDMYAYSMLRYLAQQPQDVKPPEQLPFAKPRTDEQRFIKDSYAFVDQLNDPRMNDVFIGAALIHDIVEQLRNSCATLRNDESLPDLTQWYRQWRTFDQASLNREQVMPAVKRLRTAARKLMSSSLCTDQCRSDLSVLLGRLATPAVGRWRRPEQQRMIIIRTLIVELRLIYRLLKPYANDRYTRRERIGDDELLPGHAPDEYCDELKRTPFVVLCTSVAESVMRTYEWRGAFPDDDTLSLSVSDLTGAITIAADLVDAQELSVWTFEHLRHRVMGGLG